MTERFRPSKGVGCASACEHCGKLSWVSSGIARYACCEHACRKVTRSRPVDMFILRPGTSRGSIPLKYFLDAGGGAFAVPFWAFVISTSMQKQVDWAFRIGDLDPGFREIVDAVYRIGGADAVKSLVEGYER